MVFERAMVSDMRRILRGWWTPALWGHVLACGLFVLAQRTISALTRRRLGDGYRRVSDMGSVGTPIMCEAVTQEIGIVALLETVQTLVSTAGFGARQTRMCHRLRNVQLEAEFYGRDPIGVPGARLVFQRDPCIALSKCRQRVAGVLHLRSKPIDAAALFHAGSHLGPQHCMALAVPFLVQQRQRLGRHVSRLVRSARGRARPANRG